MRKGVLVVGGGGERDWTGRGLLWGGGAGGDVLLKGTRCGVWIDNGSCGEGGLGGGGRGMWRLVCGGGGGCGEGGRRPIGGISLFVWAN